MNSTFMALELGRRGLGSHQKALEVTGHNISNADNENYSRQRVIIQSEKAIYAPAYNRANGPGMIGQGSEVSRIERIRSQFIEDRLHTEYNQHNYWKTKHDFLYQIQVVYNEPSGNSLRTRFDQFWNSWQELSKYPQEGAVRNVLTERARSLSSEIRHVFNKFHELQKQSDILVKDRVDQINKLAKEIANLNEGIVKSEALGDLPNDLYDKRDKLINDLSKIVNVQLSRSDKDEFIVMIGSENLVQGAKVQLLESRGNSKNNGFYDIHWVSTDKKPTILGGELKALLDVRDVVLRRNINEMDSLAINMTTMINEIHRDGFGLNERTNLDFFSLEKLSEDMYGNWDSDGDGQVDKSAVYKVSGVNALNEDAEVGISGTLTFHSNDEDSTPIYIGYQATDKIKDVIHKINISEAGLVAYLNHNKQLAIKAKLSEDGNQQNHFILRHLEDSGEFLVGLSGILRNSGTQGSYSWNRINDVSKLQGGPIHYDLTPEFHPAQLIQVNDDLIKNPNSIAASKGKDIAGTGDPNQMNGKGDGSNALQIVALRGSKSVMIEANASFDDYFSGMIARSGAEAAESRDHADNKKNLLSNIENMKESLSGVNLDEEMANMIQYQNSYNASARYIAMVNQMLDTIIRLGT